MISNMKKEGSLLQFTRACVGRQAWLPWRTGSATTRCPGRPPPPGTRARPHTPGRLATASGLNEVLCVLTKRSGMTGRVPRPKCHCFPSGRSRNTFSMRQDSQGVGTNGNVWVKFMGRISQVHGGASDWVWTGPPSVGGSGKCLKGGHPALWAREGRPAPCPWRHQLEVANS